MPKTEKKVDATPAEAAALFDRSMRARLELDAMLEGIEAAARREQKTGPPWQRERAANALEFVASAKACVEAGDARGAATWALKAGAVGEWLEITGRRENDPLILLGELRKALGMRSDQQLRALLHRHPRTRVNRKRHGKRLYIHVVDLLRALVAERSDDPGTEGEMAFRSVPKYRCPLCGEMLNVYPCPACMAGY